MTTTYQLESWPQYYNDPQRALLWAEHYAEFLPAHEARMPMGPDLTVYEALASSGALLVMTARQAGLLVGYCIVMCRRHIHYSALCGFEDSYFVTKESRKGMVGYKLFKATLAALKRRGVVRAYFMTKEFNSVASLFERLGMSKIDSVYAIWLED